MVVPPGNHRDSDLRRTCSVRRKARDPRTPGRTVRSAVTAGGSCIMRVKACILRRCASRFCEVSTMAASHTPGHDRRKRERFDIRYSVTIKGPLGTVSGETKNVSSNGALITCASRELLLPGATLDLTIKHASHSSVETSARVVWSNVRGFRHDSLIRWIGVRFIGRD
jgi:hypothetical protein